MTSQTIEHPTPCFVVAGLLFVVAGLLTVPRDEPTTDFAILDPWPAPWRRPLHSLVWLARLLWGVASLLVLLTWLAATPVGSIFVLGYLIYAQEQVARSGKLRRALPGLPAAGRLGELAIAMAVCLMPVWWLASAAKDAWLISPLNPTAWILLAALVVASVLAAAHILLAIARGGSLGCFLRPLRNIRWMREQWKSGGYWVQADAALREFMAALRPGHSLRLGVLGFAGTCAWLAIPMVIYSTCRGGTHPWQQGLVVLGSVWLMGALAWLPFLQVQMAVEDRGAAIFELRSVRELFRHSPLAWLLATTALYASSIPLFLYSAHLRLHAPIHDVWWDLALVSLVCTFPARVLVARAYHRATVRGPSWMAWVWFCRLVLIGLLAIYVWLLFQTPMTHEVTPWQLEYHALLLPVPW